MSSSASTSGKGNNQKTSASDLVKQSAPMQQQQQQQQLNISPVPKKDANGKLIPDSCDGTMVRIRLFDDRERVLVFKVWNAQGEGRNLAGMGMGMGMGMGRREAFHSLGSPPTPVRLSIRRSTHFLTSRAHSYIHSNLLSPLTPTGQQEPERKTGLRNDLSKARHCSGRAELLFLVDRRPGLGYSL